MPSFRDLLERRVPQYVGLYLGAGWGLIEFSSMLEERYSLAPVWTDITLLAWLLLLPSVVLFTYHHGRPGADRWAKIEKLAIPVNVLVAAIVLGTAFAGRELSATVTQVTITDESGRTVTRAVANAAYRKRLAIFNFDAPAQDTAVTWLRGALPNILNLDLSQNIFLDMRLQVQFRERLREAGYRDGEALPLSLKRRIADDLHLPYFVAGRVESAAGGYTVTTQLYDSRTGTLLKERSATGGDVMQLVDELSLRLQEDLGLPAAAAAGVTDLPAADLLSSSPAAARAFLEGMNAIAGDDWARGEQSFVRATEQDPRFGLAHFALYQARAMIGNAQAGLPSLTTAMENLHRIPERQQFFVKIEHFISNERDMDKAFAVATMFTELYPDDLQGHLVRAQLETYRNDRKGAITSLRRVVELDPQQHERQLEIGAMQEQLGRHGEALSTYQEYAKAFPADVTAQIRVARAQQALGQLEQARATLDRASLLEPNSVEVRTELATLHRNTGEFEAAWRQLESAAGTAKTAEDQVRYLTALAAYHSFRGEMQASIRAGEARLQAIARIQPPMVVVAQRMNLLGRYVEAGEEARARAMLDEVRVQMQGAIADFWRLGQLEIGVATRDTVALTEAIAGVRSIMETFGLRSIEGDLVHAEGVLNEVRGDWQNALRAYTRQKEAEGNALSVNRDLSRVYRHLNRGGDAQRAIQDHLRRMPMSPESNIEAARVQLLLGNRSAAAEHITLAKRALATADPGYRLMAELRQVEQELAGR